MLLSSSTYGQYLHTTSEVSSEMRWFMALVFMAVFGVACGEDLNSGADKLDRLEVKMADETVTTASGLQIKTLVVGTGDKAEPGKTAVVHYTGWLLNGTKFDSSVDRGTPFEFPLGAGRVIKGWDEGVSTMNIGGKVELIIPPDLAYGPSGAGGVIPPNATLKFEVEFLDQK